MWWEHSKISGGDKVHNSVILLKFIELHTWGGWTLWYVNYTSTNVCGGFFLSKWIIWKKQLPIWFYKILRKEDFKKIKIYACSFKLSWVVLYLIQLIITLLFLPKYFTGFTPCWSYVSVYLFFPLNCEILEERLLFAFIFYHPQCSA